jgi:hypothetical protein
VDLTKVTIKPGADLNSASNEELSPLQLAAKHGHLRLVQWLLKSGATVGAADKNGFTALHEAGADAAAQSTEEVGVIEVGTTAAALAEKGERCRSVAKENPSTSNTRLSRVLHSIQRELRLARPGRMIARVCAWSDLGLRRGWGTISSLQAARGANTPWYSTWFLRGGDTRAASRSISSSRDNWMAPVPSAQGCFRRITTVPAVSSWYRGSSVEVIHSDGRDDDLLLAEPIDRGGHHQLPRCLAGAHQCGGHARLCGHDLWTR